MMRPDNRNMLRAEGNLGYLEFVRLVAKLWGDGHPDIPVLPTDTTQPAAFPCITYQLDLRRPMQNEPKPKIREIIDQDGTPYVISAQRFQSIVTFTAMDNVQSDSRPHTIIGTLVEEVIEIFENFMIEYQPVFKRLGVSELVYARRNPDTSASHRNAPDQINRSISYMLTTEKIIKTQFAKLEAIEVNARIWIDQGMPEAESATPNVTISITDQLSNS